MLGYGVQNEKTWEVFLVRRHFLWKILAAILMSSMIINASEMVLKVTKENWGVRKTSFNTQQVSQVFKPTVDNIERLSLDIAHASAPKGDPTGIPLLIELYEVDKSYRAKGKPIAQTKAVPDKSSDFMEIPFKASDLDTERYYCFIITTGDGDNNWRLSVRELSTSLDENEIVSYKYFVYDAEWMPKKNHSLSFRIISNVPVEE